MELQEKTMPTRFTNEELTKQNDELKKEITSLKEKVDMYDYYRSQTIKLTDKIEKYKRAFEAIGTISDIASVID